MRASSTICTIPEDVTLTFTPSIRRVKSAPSRTPAAGFRRNLRFLYASQSDVLNWYETPHNPTGYDRKVTYYNVPFNLLSPDLFVNDVSYNTRINQICETAWRPGMFKLPSYCAEDIPPEFHKGVNYAVQTAICKGHGRACQERALHLLAELCTDDHKALKRLAFDHARVFSEHETGLGAVRTDTRIQSPNTVGPFHMGFIRYVTVSESLAEMLCKKSTIICV